jgi:hypothetical protein
MAVQLLVDTDVLIDYLRGQANAAAYLVALNLKRNRAGFGENLLGGSIVEPLPRSAVE